MKGIPLVELPGSRMILLIWPTAAECPSAKVGAPDGAKVAGFNERDVARFVGGGGRPACLRGETRGPKRLDAAPRTASVSGPVQSTVGEAWTLRHETRILRRRDGEARRK